MKASTSHCHKSDCTGSATRALKAACVLAGSLDLLFAPDDLAAFAAALREALALPHGERDRLVAAARARARQLFSEDAYVAAMLDLYRGLPLPRRAAGEGAA